MRAGAGRVWPVAGLAVLSGGTAIAAVADVRPLPATVSLLILAIGLECALLDEVRLQARRTERWTRTDTLIAGILAGAALVAGWTATIAGLPGRILLTGALLAGGYAALGGSFVGLRRRAVPGPPPSPQR